MQTAKLLALLSTALLLTGTAICGNMRWNAAPEFQQDSRVPPSVMEEIREVEARINRIESETLQRAHQGSLSSSGEVTLLGKLILFDENLSVNRNEACAFCHMPETGFSGPVSALNATTVSYPGSVRTRFGKRKPQTHSYASYTPVLHYNGLQQDFVGGAFWDMRATGIRLNNPIAEQAEAPPLSAAEMGLSDSACVVYRVSISPYRFLAQRVWGAQAFTIQWPDDVESVCSRPAQPPAWDRYPVHLSAIDRGAANRTFDQVAEAIAAYESSSEVNAFSSKFDFVMAGEAKFSPDEKAGYALFRSAKTHCNECHRDGGPGEEPLFTDFTASNLGLPINRAIPFYFETVQDEFGYAPNALGFRYIDAGVGGFLNKEPQLSGSLNSNEEWVEKASEFQGRFKVPTLRNVDKRPRPDFVKAYMHNGYLKSLKEVVHFYNTRDTLRRCELHDPGERVSCWPEPEFPRTISKKQLGNLGLSDKQEDQLVAFLKTLSDGYEPSRK
jgi:cytochrome c peroxidase